MRTLTLLLSLMQLPAAASLAYTADEVETRIAECAGQYLAAAQLYRQSSEASPLLADDPDAISANVKSPSGAWLRGGDDVRLLRLWDGELVEFPDYMSEQTAADAVRSHLKAIAAELETKARDAQRLAKDLDLSESELKHHILSGIWNMDNTAVRRYLKHQCDEFIEDYRQAGR